MRILKNVSPLRRSPATRPSGERPYGNNINPKNPSKKNVTYAQELKRSTETLDSLVARPTQSSLSLHHRSNRGDSYDRYISSKLKHYEETYGAFASSRASV